ncbi:1,2-phenylacetyl-CoA epoxidase subunit PaaC [Natrialbaceae archaeon AArc-T1-2]|uniref:1,2-phenylacetyl-CoA epoxidase subunit PaaC n=1 Tax=Natrialbaceae archaeon AArc-T1-2 TaxID=3053904 RepID=UPI00255B1240|nr:Phenylacetic acid catabolic protein [Natrialbaceae archaeon AArc-T1-2]WIV68866.1 phenylacetate-CoA oxygenase subunit PaaI [Natrialbaceae archaeon AArc-T1-2]
MGTSTDDTVDPEEALKSKLDEGHMIEDPSEATEVYRKVLTETTNIAGDLEMMSFVIYYPALLQAPSIETKIQAAQAIHDELGHAVLQYAVVEDFGGDTQELIMDRDPEEWKTFFMTEWANESWYEFAVAQALGDRAGRMTTVDLEEHCSYAPYSRSLQKVNFEQQWHVKNGERNMRKLVESGEEHKERIQEVVDFFFPLAAEWFGTTDDKKKRWTQLDYHIRGHTNDEMRQKWLAEVVPMLEDMGLEVPAHYDEDADEYVLEYEYPVLYDYERGEWDLENHATWEEKFEQWRQGGPDKIGGISRLQEEVWGEDLWQANDEWVRQYLGA